jgi:hypothetical protein
MWLLGALMLIGNTSALLLLDCTHEMNLVWTLLGWMERTLRHLLKVPSHITMAPLLLLMYGMELTVLQDHGRPEESGEAPYVQALV